MATKIPVNFKGSHKKKTSSITIEELPIKGDFLDMDGEVMEVTKKIFHYDANGAITQVTFELA